MTVSLLTKDADQIRCMSFHPSGDFLVVGTNQTVIRLYDINTAQCYVCSFPSHFHADGITSLKYNRYYFLHDILCIYYISPWKVLV